MEKQRWEGSERRRQEVRRSERRKSEKKEDAGARKRRKVTIHCVKMQVREKVGKSRFTVFPMVCGSRGSKSNLAKAAGAEPSGQMRNENKLHAAVARSSFPSKIVQNSPCSDYFWKLRGRKRARRCGAKHICNQKRYKHLTFGPVLEVERSKMCTPLWREAHL